MILATDDDQKPIPSIRRKVIIVGTGIGILYWIFESIVMTFFTGGRLSEQLLAPSLHEIWHRFWILLFILGFAFHADFLLHKYKVAEKAMRNSEKKYRLLVELSPDAICIQSEDQIIFCNHAGAQLVGADRPEQLIGQSLWDFVPEAYQEKVIQQFRAIQEEEGKSARIETTFRQTDGTLIDVEISAISFLYKDSGTLAIQAICRDVTVRKQEQAELIKLRKAVEASGEVIFMTNREGIITYVNPEFSRLYGYASQEVVGQVTPRILKSGKWSQGNYEHFWEMLHNKQVVKGELVNRCKDGKFVHIGGSANPILDEEENIIGFLAIQRDITESKRAEAEIQQRNKELVAFNNIITTINQSLNLNQILNDVLDEVLWLDMLGDTSKGMIFLLDEATGALSLAVGRGAADNLPCLSNPPQLGDCLCGQVIKQGKAIVAQNGLPEEQHSRHCPEMADHQDICLPLKVRQKVLGAMNLQLPVERQITEADLQMLTAVADQIGVAIENAQLFAAVSRQRKRLHQMSMKLAETEETERQRLANELHDQVGQNLTALGINLNIIRSLMPENGNTVTFTRLDESLRLVDQITERIRSVMSDLRPPMLDDCGLIATLRWYSNQVSSRTGIFVTVKGEDRNLSLPSTVETALFRIAQEALTNVTKHAQATQVNISLLVENGVARLVIADNGIGFELMPETSFTGDRGFGLLIMKERAEAVNGRCWIESQLGSPGTQVITEVTL